MAARAARMRAMAEMSPDSEALSASAEQSGWNTAYRAGLENALDAVRDSKKMMRNLRTIRQRQKDMDEGVEIGHLKGKTAKEANAEWEKQRLEARDAERRRRVAAAERGSAAANARATETKNGVAGLPSLPDFLKKSSLDADGEGAEAAARALAAKHGEWIRTLDGDGGIKKNADMEAKERRSRTLSASAPASDESAETRTDHRDDSTSSESLTNESLPNEEDTETSFFENLTSLSPLRRAARAKTDRDEDFWNREMWGGDDFDADGEIESAEAEMAKLCAAEISGARRLSVGEE